MDIPIAAVLKHKVPFWFSKHTSKWFWGSQCGFIIIITVEIWLAVAAGSLRRHADGMSDTDTESASQRRTDQYEVNKDTHESAVSYGNQHHNTKLKNLKSIKHWGEIKKTKHEPTNLSVLERVISCLSTVCFDPRRSRAGESILVLCSPDPSCGLWPRVTVHPGSDRLRSFVAMRYVQKSRVVQDLYVLWCLFDLFYIINLWTNIFQTP